MRSLFKQELKGFLDREGCDLLEMDDRSPAARQMEQLVCTRGGPIPRPTEEISGTERMIGESASMWEVKSWLLKVGSSDSNVLITGETGTGKELATEIIHRNSPRRDGPLVSVNCAAIPDTLVESELFGSERGAFTGAMATRDGKFHLANGGTIFLDEIGDMSLYAQAKVLRVAEAKEVCRLGGNRGVPLDVRIVAATNCDLESLVREGKFRRDLYYRLDVARVHLPPLRERKEDMPHLVRHLIAGCNARSGRNVEGFAGEALEILYRHDWPGNVRELKNLVEASFINLPGKHITVIDLPQAFRSRFRLAEQRPRDERERLLSALSSTNWNKSRTAEKLRWSRTTIYRKMARYGIRSASCGE